MTVRNPKILMAVFLGQQTILPVPACGSCEPVAGSGKGDNSVGSDPIATRSC